jgi:ABC-type polar amino acid transport system ATPase subunit
VPTPDVRALFDEALALGRTLIAPRAAVRWVEVTAQEGDTLVTPEARLTIPDIARHWADKIALMEEGRVVHVAPPREFFASPAWRARIGADLWLFSDATSMHHAPHNT